jgi:hypothetical protein
MEATCSRVSEYPSGWCPESEADRAVEVALRVHLDEGEAGVLLVLGAEAAVEWAAVMHLGLELERDGARLVVAQLSEVELRVGIDQRFERAVLRTALAHDDLVVTDVQLRVDHALAKGADRTGQLEKDLVSVDLPRTLDTRHPSLRCIVRRRRCATFAARSHPTGFRPSPGRS